MMPMTTLTHSIPSWLELVALAYCMGTLVCRLWVLPPADGTRPAHQENLIKRLSFLFGIGISVALVGSATDFLVRTAEMSNTPVRFVFPLLPTVILKTHFGMVWLIRMSGLIGLAVMVYAGKRYRDSRAALWFMFLVGSIIAMTHSATGHAADKGDLTPAEFMDWFHLLGALVWGGGLLVLALTLAPALAALGDKSAHTFAEVAARFSRIAGMAVGVIVITSLYHAWIYVGSVEALEETDYGLIVVAKIVLFLLLFILAAFNRYVIVPGLMTAAGIPADSGMIGRLIAAVLPPFAGSQKGRSAAGRFRKIVGTEAILILGVLLCAVLLRHEIPASHYLHREHAGGQEAHMHQVNTGPEITLRIETDSAEIVAGTPVLITARLEDQKGRPIRGMLVHHERLLHAVIIGSDLRTFAHIHPEDLGPITGEMLNKATFPLRFTFPKAGAYLLGIDFATQDGLYSKTAMLMVAGRPKMGAPSMYASRQKDFGAYHMTLVLFPKRIHAGEETALHFRIAKRGKPVTGLEPYLGAPMHLAVARSDLTQFIHAHGYSPGDLHMRLGHREAAPSERYGPEIDADITFPASGVYKIFCEVRHEGKVLLFDFMVRVEEAGKEEK
jgi:putative copper export protein